MLLFVPLGDIVERRRLMLLLLCAVTVALLGVAAAPTLPLLAVARSRSASPPSCPSSPSRSRRTSRRNRNAAGRWARVMGGLLVGILLARTVSGFLGAHLGWRAVYVISAALMLVLATALRALLPRSPADAHLPYPALLRSLVTLTRQDRVLRESALLGALGFAAFSAFWSTLAFFLEVRHGPRLGRRGALRHPGGGGRAGRARPGSSRRPRQPARQRRGGAAHRADEMTGSWQRAAHICRASSPECSCSTSGSRATTSRTWRACTPAAPRRAAG